MRQDEIWQRFAALPGAAVERNVGIASAHAIGGLIGTLNWLRPERALEVGGGIGTLTYTILDTVRRQGRLDDPAFRLVTVESHPFCLEQLARNLGELEGRSRVVPSTAELQKAGETFDLIVLDGGGDAGNDLGVQDLHGLLAPGGAILVEGYRKFQRDRFSEWFRDRPFVHLRNASLRPILYNAASGLRAENKPYHLFLFEPSFSQRLRLKVQGAANRLMTAVARRLSPRQG